MPRQKAYRGTRRPATHYRPSDSSSIHHYFTLLSNPKHERLTSEEEHEHLSRIHDGSISMERIINAHLRFVVKVAMEYRGLGVPFEDLIGYGNLGVIEAARRYDPGRRVSFATYAVWWIRRTILKGIEWTGGGDIRVPTYQQRKLRAIRAMQQEIIFETGKPADLITVAERLGEPIEKIRTTLLRATPQLDELDDTAFDDNAEPKSAKLKDENQISAADRAIANDDARFLHQLMESLSDKERLVLRHRYGIDGAPAMTQPEIGKLLNVRKQRVEQIEREAEKKMRRAAMRTHSPRGWYQRKTKD